MNRAQHLAGTLKLLQLFCRPQRGLTATQSRVLKNAKVAVANYFRDAVDAGKLSEYADALAAAIRAPERRDTAQTGEKGQSIRSRAIHRTD